MFVVLEHYIISIFESQRAWHMVVFLSSGMIRQPYMRELAMNKA